jgi:hypothetical protein
VKTASCLLFLATLGCTKPAPPVATPAPAAAVETCTAETPLVPGVPGSPGHLVESPLNPNGMSELALLMRRMVADLEAARDVIERGGQPPALAARYQKLRCSWPTRAEMRSKEFDGLAQTYLQQVAEFDEHRGELRDRYANVLKGCRACHEVTCEGPIAVIDGLALRPVSAR